MSKDFSSADKSEWGIRPGNPKITRKIGGKLEVEVIGPTDTADAEDWALEGLASIPRGRATGFSNFLSQHQATDGPERTDALPRHSNYDNDDNYSGDDLDQLAEFGEDMSGDQDLLGQPVTRNRKEYGDFIEDLESVDGAENQYDTEQRFDTDIADLFEDRPHRRMQASRDTVAEDLLNVFAEFE